jgi:hypothetical protein
MVVVVVVVGFTTLAFMLRENSIDPLKSATPSPFI